MLAFSTCLVPSTSYVLHTCVATHLRFRLCGILNLRLAQLFLHILDGVLLLLELCIGRGFAVHGIIQRGSFLGFVMRFGGSGGGTRSGAVAGARGVKSFGLETVDFGLGLGYVLWVRGTLVLNS